MVSLSNHRRGMAPLTLSPKATRLGESLSKARRLKFPLTLSLSKGRRLWFPLVQSLSKGERACP